jgi:hypothetical protein
VSQLFKKYSSNSYDKTKTENSLSVRNEEGFNLKERMHLRTFRLNVTNLRNTFPFETSWRYSIGNQTSLYDLFGERWY